MQAIFQAIIAQATITIVFVTSMIETYGYMAVKQAMDALQTPGGLDGLDAKGLSRLFTFNSLFAGIKPQGGSFNAEDAFLRGLINLGTTCTTDQLHAEICRLKGKSDVSFDQVGVHARRFTNWTRESGAYTYNSSTKTHRFNPSQFANWLIAQVSKPADKHADNKAKK